MVKMNPFLFLCQFSVCVVSKLHAKWLYYLFSRSKEGKLYKSADKMKLMNYCCFSTRTLQLRHQHHKGTCLLLLFCAPSLI